MGFLDNLKSLSPKKNYYIYVSVGQHGLETNVSDEIKSLNTAHKKLLVAFLEGIIEQLNK